MCKENKGMGCMQNGSRLVKVDYQNVKWYNLNIFLPSLNKLTLTSHWRNLSQNMLYVVYVIKSRQQTKRKQWTADNKLIVKYETNINKF